LTIGGSNGRLARAITGRLLAQGYCTALERCQRGDLDVTAWLSWFLEQLSAAAASHGAVVDAMQRKAISLTKVSRATAWRDLAQLVGLQAIEPIGEGRSRAHPLVISSTPPPASDLEAPPPRWPGLDRLGTTQAFGGLALGLIALFSSYDHVTLAGRSLQLQQQWGIIFIAASVATVVVVDAVFSEGVAQLASRSRLREADERLEERNRLQLSEAVALLMDQLRGARQAR
jgi:hypothetical protein